MSATVSTKVPYTWYISAGFFLFKGPKKFLNVFKGVNTNLLNKILALSPSWLPFK